MADRLLQSNEGRFTLGFDRELLVAAGCGLLPRADCLSDERNSNKRDFVRSSGI